MKKPDKWFKDMVDRSAGRNLDEFRLMDRLYQETQALKQDRFDDRKFDEVMSMAIELAEIVNERAIDHPTWQNLVQDTYLALWKMRPELRDQTQIRPSHIVNWATLNKLLDASEYEEIRTWTTVDDWASAMGTVSLAARLAQFFDEQEDLMEKSEKLAQQEQELIDFLDQMQKEYEEGLTDEEIDEALDDMIDRLNEYGEATDELENSATANGTGIKSAVNEAMSEAKESAEEAESLVAGFGTHPGQWSKLDPRVRMKLAKRLNGNPTLLKIAKMVGRMKRLAIGQWSRRVVHGTDEIYDVTIGNDLEHVLPSEWMYLADEDTEDIFWSKFMEKTLLQYDLRGKEKQAKGAMIVLMDNSYSMHGEREIWAKAVALSLLEICKRERRDFYGIHFSHGSTNLAEWHFKKGEVEIEDVLDYAEHFWGGGTDFETPISRGVQVLEEQFNREGAKKGDIIMITDGEAAVSDEWLVRYFNAREALDFRMYGILIGHYGPVLETLSDAMFKIDDIMSGGEVKEVFSFV